MTDTEKVRRLGDPRTHGAPSMSGGHGTTLRGGAEKEQDEVSERESLSASREGLREVTVNGERFFNAQDVEAWHRHLTRRADLVSLYEEIAQAQEQFIQHTLDEYGDRMPSQWKAHARTLLRDAEAEPL